MNVWVDPSVITVNAMLGAFFASRALLNLNQITPRTCVSLLVVNLVLFVGGLCMAVMPFYGNDLAGIGQIMVNGALAGVMVYGRREADQVAPRPQ